MSGAGLFYLARLFPGILNLSLVLFLTRFLPITDYGKFSTWFALCLGGAFLLFGWISQSVARHANAKDDILGRFPEVFIVAFCLSALCALILAAPAVWLLSPPADFNSYIVLFLSITLHGLHSIISATQQAKLKFARYVFSEVSRPLFTFILCLIFVAIVRSESEVAKTAYVLGQLIAVFSLLFVFRRESSWLYLRLRKLPTRPKEVSAALRRIFIYGAPISIWLAINASWPAVERRLIKMLSGSHEVGIYAAEYDIAFRAFVFALLPITLYSQPYIFRAYSNADFQLVDRLIYRAILLQLCIGVLFSVLYLAFLFVVLNGQDAFSTMRIENVTMLCAAAIAWQIALSSHKWLECKKRIGFMLLAQSLSLAIGVGISLTFYSRLGTLSFASGLTAAGLIYSLTCSFIGKRIREKS